MGESVIRGVMGPHLNLEIPISGEVLFGRNASTCNVVFPSTEKMISGLHCKVYEQNGQVYLVDLGSTNGTFLSNGMRLTPNCPQAINNSEGFYLGSSQNSYILLNDLNNHEQSKTVNATQEPVITAKEPVILQQKQSTYIIFAVVALIIVSLLVGLIMMKKEISQKESENYQLQEEIYQQENQYNQLQQEYDDYQNRGVIDKTMDAVGDWIDIFN